jgi:hypothetical protein
MKTFGEGGAGGTVSRIHKMISIVSMGSEDALAWRVFFNSLLADYPTSCRWYCVNYIQLWGPRGNKKWRALSATTNLGYRNLLLLFYISYIKKVKLTL